MAGRCLLDTNAVIAYLKDDPTVPNLVDEVDDVCLCPTVLGELYYGAEKSGRTEQNLARIESFAAECTVLVNDTEVARRYGRVKRQLQRLGQMIPENDMWIAAAALVHQLPLMTRDAHFSRIEELDLVGW